MSTDHPEFSKPRVYEGSRGMDWEDTSRPGSHFLQNTLHKLENAIAFSPTESFFGAEASIAALAFAFGKQPLPAIGLSVFALSRFEDALHKEHEVDKLVQGERSNFSNEVTHPSLPQDRHDLPLLPDVSFFGSAAAEEMSAENEKKPEAK